MNVGFDAQRPLCQIVQSAPLSLTLPRTIPGAKLRPPPDIIYSDCLGNSKIVFTGQGRNEHPALDLYRVEYIPDLRTSQPPISINQLCGTDKEFSFLVNMSGKGGFSIVSEDLQPVIFLDWRELNHSRHAMLGVLHEVGHSHHADFLNALAESILDGGNTIPRFSDDRYFNAVRVWLGKKIAGNSVEFCRVLAQARETHALCPIGYAVKIPHFDAVAEAFAWHKAAAIAETIGLKSLPHVQYANAYLAKYDFLSRTKGHREAYDLLKEAANAGYFKS